MIYWRNPPRRNKTLEFVEWLLTVALVFTVGKYTIDGIRSAIEKPTAPIEGAKQVEILAAREGDDQNLGFNTGSYIIYNDGDTAGGILVTVQLRNSSYAEAKALSNGQTMEVDQYIIQNWFGDLIIWGSN